MFDVSIGCSKYYGLTITSKYLGTLDIVWITPSQVIVVDLSYYLWHLEIEHTVENTILAREVDGN